MAFPEDKPFLDRIEKGQYYDAFIIVSASISRLIKKSEHLKAYDLCCRINSRFVEEKQYLLAYNLLNSIMKSSKNTKFPLEETHIQAILKTFEIKTSAEMNEERFGMLEKLIDWVQNDYEAPAQKKKRLLKKLHDTISTAYIHLEEFGLAQHHLFKSRNVTKIVQMLSEWKSHVYHSEIHYITLRCILGLLMQGDISLATEVLLDKSLGYDIHDNNLPAPIQCCYMMCEAVKIRSDELYQLISRKYHLILRKDPSFKGILEHIEKRYFSTSIEPSFDINTLISQIFA